MQLQVEGSRLQISYGRTSYGLILKNEDVCQKAQAWLERERNKLRDYKLKQIMKLFADTGEEREEDENEDEDEDDEKDSNEDKESSAVEEEEVREEEKEFEQHDENGGSVQTGVDEIGKAQSGEDDIAIAAKTESERKEQEDDKRPVDAEQERPSTVKDEQQPMPVTEKEKEDARDEDDEGAESLVQGKNKTDAS